MPYVICWFLKLSGQKQSRVDNKKDRPSSASQTRNHQQTSSRRPQTALPQSQQRKEQNSQHEKPRQTRSSEPRSSQQERNYSNNQSNRNSRRGNQRPLQRNMRRETSNEKKEKPKEEAAHSAKTSETSEQQSKPGKEKQSQSEVEKVNPQQSEVSKNDQHAQSGNRNRQAREQRDFGDERPRNRNRRRGGRRGAPDGQNERGHSKDMAQKRDDGPQEKGPSERGPVEKSPLASEEKKSAVKEEAAERDVKMDTVSNTKDATPVAKDVEKHNGVSKSQDVAVVNGKETDAGNNSEGLNGEKSNERESSIKEALPQRQERGSRRRGGQRDRRDGPSSRPTPNRDLNRGKPVENGVGHSNTEKESGVQMSQEGSQSKKLPVTENETKIGSCSAQEHDKGLDKAYVPIVNGYIPVKELNEGSIGR